MCPARARRGGGKCWSCYKHLCRLAWPDHYKHLLHLTHSWPAAPRDKNTDNEALHNSDNALVMSNGSLNALLGEK